MADSDSVPGTPDPGDSNNREARAPLPTLKPREIEILRLLAQGLTSSEIAAAMEIQLCTARNYVQRLLKKCDAHTRAEAVACFPVERKNGERPGRTVEAKAADRMNQRGEHGGAREAGEQQPMTVKSRAVVVIIPTAEGLEDLMANGPYLQALQILKDGGHFLLKLRGEAFE